MRFKGMRSMRLVKILQNKLSLILLVSFQPSLSYGDSEYYKLVQKDLEKTSYHMICHNSPVSKFMQMNEQQCVSYLRVNSNQCNDGLKNILPHIINYEDGIDIPKEFAAAPQQGKDILHSFRG